MKVVCSHCGQCFESKEKHIFGQFQCPNCNALFYRDNLKGIGVRVYGFYDYYEYKKVCKLVEGLGGVIQGRITKKGCHLVILGGDFESYLDTAEKYGIPEISRKDFMANLFHSPEEEREYFLQNDFLEPSEVNYDFEKQRAKERYLRKISPTFQYPSLDKIKPCEFSGCNICFTGFSKPDKEILTQICIKLDIKQKSSVIKKLDYLVTGATPGGCKMIYAKELNIPIVTAEDFLQRIALEKK